MLLFEEKSDSNLANVIMGPFITAVLHSFSCIYFWVLLQGKWFLSSLGKLIEGKCIKLGAGVLAKDLALMGTALSLLLCGHTWKREACSILEVPFEQSGFFFLLWNILVTSVCLLGSFGGCRVLCHRCVCLGVAVKDMGMAAFSSAGANPGSALPQQHAEAGTRLGGQERRRVLMLAKMSSCGVGWLWHSCVLQQRWLLAGQLRFPDVVHVIPW